jgi:hypothetical protein
VVSYAVQKSCEDLKIMCARLLQAGASFDQVTQMWRSAWPLADRRVQMPNKRRNGNGVLNKDKLREAGSWAQKRAPHSTWPPLFLTPPSVVCFPSALASHSSGDSRK